MLTTRDAIQQHVACMSDAEAARWLEAMDALTTGDSAYQRFTAAVKELRSWHAKVAGWNAQQAPPVAQGYRVEHAPTEAEIQAALDFGKTAEQHLR
jgi:hypothetical protein